MNATVREAVGQVRRMIGTRRRPPALRGVQPLSRKFGGDRGTPIDRYYIEDFLARHAADIRGRVLEIGDDAYTRRFGGAAVTTSDVLNPAPGPGTTLVGDLTDAAGLPAGVFDCVILTQVLLVIYDVRAALRGCFHVLRPGGVLLVTVPGISQISRYDAQRWGDFWRFTPPALRRLLEEHCPPDAVTFDVRGNVRTAAAFLYGLAMEELSAAELDYVDEDYPVTIAARAVRPVGNPVDPRAHAAGGAYR